MVIFKGVNFYPRQIEQVLLRQPGLSHEYQIVLDADGGGERMTVMIEAEPGCDAVVATRVRRELHDLLSLSPDLKLCRSARSSAPRQGGSRGRFAGRGPPARPDGTLERSSRRARSPSSASRAIPPSSAIGCSRT